MISGKRIIIVLGIFELGGAERQALLLARHLKNEEGAHVQIWGFHTPGRMAQLCDVYGISWRIVPLKLTHQPIQLLINLFKYARKLRNERPDILFAYTIFPNIICGLVWRLTGAKIYIWNQRDAGIERFVSKILERIAVFNTKHFVSNSHQGSDFLIKTFGLNRKSVRVIHNGIKLDSPQADRLEWLERLGISESCMRVCMVANLYSPKDHITLLKAWR
ncbi:MAG: glycosyltransferase, partial [Candidatus Shapirobacteria bacterium]|nr:glycosyltransferase [Candidatus Shapirobacteria bacterium]